jgi:hypothetical protein
MRSKDRGLFTVGAFPEGHAVNAQGCERNGHRVRDQARDGELRLPLRYGRSQHCHHRRHESDAGLHRCLARRPDFQAYAAQFHTTTSQLTELAKQAKPGLLILYHASLSWRPVVDAERSTPTTLLKEMSGYPGRVVIGRDLDVY